MDKYGVVRELQLIEENAIQASLILKQADSTIRTLPNILEGLDSYEIKNGLSGTLVMVNRAAIALKNIIQRMEILKKV